MVQNRKILFIENFLAYGAIAALDKVVPLIMLPIVTRLLPNTADYGKFEMFNAIVGFGSSFAILGMYDAMFREYFEKDDCAYKNMVTSTALKIVFAVSILTSVFLIILCKPLSKIFLGDSSSFFIVIMASIGVFLTANKTIISAPTRMRNQRKIYVFSGISYSLVYYVTAILFITFGMHYNGLIYGNIIASLYILSFFFFLNYSAFNFLLFDKKVAKELLKIGAPLVPCFIIYWAFNSMDKIMISHMLSMKEVGVYAIGAKVASVSMFIYTAFAGGWQYFAFSTMKDKDQVELTSKIFEYLGVLSFLIFTISVLFNNAIFHLFFVGDYVRGAIVFPYLFLSQLILMLFQTAGNQLLIVKKSYLSTICLLVGLMLNFALNYFMIPVFGIRGAAFATLVGYTLSVLVMMLLTNSLGLIIYKKRFIQLSAMMCGLVMTIFINLNSKYTIYLSIFLMLFICIIYRDEFLRLLIFKGKNNEANTN